MPEVLRVNVAERALAIVNPVAGSGAGAKLAPRLAAIFADVGMHVDIAMTPGEGEAARMARAAAAEGYATVIAVGGDGTANEVANGIAGGPTCLALYPVGTGNDLARALGYPARLADVPRVIANARPRAIDVAEVNSRVYVNSAGVGIDGVVADRARALSRSFGPRLGYLAASLSAIASYRPQPMRLTLDDEPREGRYLLVLAANGTHFGSGMNCAPQAVLDDGLLDVVMAGDLSRGAAIGTLRRLYSGTHIDGERVTASKVRSLDIELERPLPMQVDGELSYASRIEIRARPGGLQVLA